ncbi:MAG: ABC transporter permease [Bacteroidales bacterium]|nr:ABC transporter permease [Bacteroidales bacterium]MBN2817465.1 ABC transporter permease [Bacteroidales bacterium]
MNTEYFIAHRFIKSQKGSRTYTTPIIRLSVIAIAMSLAVMLISVAVVTGFKQEIRNKVIGFGGHIQILNFDSNNSFENNPIDSELDFLDVIKSLPGIKTVQAYATKPAMIKTKTEIQGVVLKGVGSDFDTSFFSQNLSEGRMIKISNIEKSNEVLISGRLADLLGLKLNDKFIAFFIDERSGSNPINRRVFNIVGIYRTSLETFDEQFIIGDIKHIQTLNAWEDYEIGGFEILIDDYKNLNLLTEAVRDIAEYRFLEDGSRLKVLNIKDINPQIFDWLSLLDMNVWVILILMVCVAVINMISGLIILILDRTPSIGLLKAIGTKNKSLKRIFLYQAGYLIIQGMVWGNLIALALLILQDKNHIIKLNQTSYFIDYAPVNINFFFFLIVNITSLITIFLFMILPVIIVTRIEPVKTLRYS